MNENVNDQDVLLVADKKNNKLDVVSEIGKDGKIKSVSPKPENEPLFLKLDKQGNVLENFFSNFHRQYKDPTHFQFFKVPANMVENIISCVVNLLISKRFLIVHTLRETKSFLPDLILKLQRFWQTICYVIT